MPLCLLPSYHPHPSCVIFMCCYFLYYTSISNCALSLFSTSSHIPTLDSFLFCVFHVKSDRWRWCDVKEHALFSWRTTSWRPAHKADDGKSKNHSSSFQIRLPGAVFSPFFCFCHSVFPHRHMDYLYPSELCATVIHLLDLFVLSQRVSLQRICPSHCDGCREQSRKTTRSHLQKSRAPAAAMIM